VSNPHVRDLTPDVFTVGPDESIDALQDLMRKKGIRHVPVVDNDGAVLGVVSERDVLQGALFQETDTVADIMTWKVETIDADEDLSTAAQIMLDNKYGCLPLVEQGVLAGILTEADFVKSMAPMGASRRR
jgi:CBS domain-containing membrane protein